MSPHDYHPGKPRPTITVAQHKVLKEQPMPKPAPRPGYKGQGTSGTGLAIDG